MGLRTSSFLELSSCNSRPMMFWNLDIFHFIALLIHTFVRGFYTSWLNSWLAHIDFLRSIWLAGNRATDTQCDLRLVLCPLSHPTHPPHPPHPHPPHPPPLPHVSSTSCQPEKRRKNSSNILPEKSWIWISSFYGRGEVKCTQQKWVSISQIFPKPSLYSCDRPPLLIGHNFGHYFSVLLRKRAWLNKGGGIYLF